MFKLLRKPLPVLGSGVPCQRHNQVLLMCFLRVFQVGMEAAGLMQDRDARIKLICIALINNLSKGMQLNRNNLK